MDCVISLTAVAGLAWSLVYKQSVGGTLYIILRMIFRQYCLNPRHVAIVWG